MMPFGGFMQAAPGAAPVPAQKPAGLAKAGDGISCHNEATMAAEDNTASFPAWVRSLISGATRGDNGHGAQECFSDGACEKPPGHSVPENADFEQLAALIHDAIPTSMDEAPTIADDSSGLEVDGQPSASPRDGSGQTTGHGIAPTVGIQAPRIAGTDQPLEGNGRHGRADGQMQVAAESKSPAAVGQQAEGMSLDQGIEPAHGSQRRVMTSIDIKGVPAETKSTPTVAAAESKAPATGDKPNPSIDHHLTSSHSAMAQSDELVLASVAPRQPLSTGGVKESIAAPKDAVSGAVRQPQSLDNTILADNPSASSEDGAARFRDSARSHSLQRNDTAQVDENEWRGNQVADSSKSSSVEPGRSQATVQDVARPEIAAKSSTIQAQSAPRVAEFTDKQLSTSVMDQIVDKASLRSIGGRSEIQIRLKPEFLGNVQMNIATDNNQLVVRVVTDQVVVKDIIETQLHQLKAELQNQGLTIEKFDVMVNPDADNQHQREQFSQMFKQPSSQHGRRQRQKQGQETVQQDGRHPAAEDDPPEGDGISYFA
jgi:flagellar hook-length control protein FliK